MWRSRSAGLRGSHPGSAGSVGPGPGLWRSRSAGLGGSRPGSAGSVLGCGGPGPSVFGGSQRLLAPRTDAALDHVPQPPAEVEVGSYHDVPLRREEEEDEERRRLRGGGAD